MNHGVVPRISVSLRKRSYAIVILYGSIDSYGFWISTIINNKTGCELSSLPYIITLAVVPHGALDI